MSERREDLQEQTRAYFRAHHAGLEPDAGFARRVLDRLDRPAAEILAWAAGKFLPATLALVLILAYFSLRSAPVAEGTSASAADDPVGWILNDAEGTR